MAKSASFLGRVLRWERLLRCGAIAKDVIGAIQLANTIKHAQIRGDALAGVATAQAEAGDVVGALRTAGTIMLPDVVKGHFHGLGGKTSALLADRADTSESWRYQRRSRPRPIGSVRKQRELPP